MKIILKGEVEPPSPFKLSEVAIANPIRISKSPRAESSTENLILQKMRLNITEG